MQRRSSKRDLHINKYKAGTRPKQKQAGSRDYAGRGCGGDKLGCFFGLKGMGPCLSPTFPEVASLTRTGERWEEGVSRLLACLLVACDCEWGWSLLVFLFVVLLPAFEWFGNLSALLTTALQQPPRRHHHQPSLSSQTHAPLPQHTIHTHHPNTVTNQPHGGRGRH